MDLIISRSSIFYSTASKLYLNVFINFISIFVHYNKSLSLKLFFFFYFIVIQINLELLFPGTCCNEDSVRRFKCDFCPYSSNHKGHMRRHYLVHSGECPHKCEICNRGFARTDGLRRHMLSHTAQKSHLCNLCNIVVFRLARSLKLQFFDV